MSLKYVRRGLRMGFEVTVWPHVRGSGVFGSGCCGCGVNRRLRCWERATATSPRRSAAFRVQGGREMKQVMRPARRGVTAPVGAGGMAAVETRIVAPRRDGVWGGLPGFCSASGHA